SIILRSFSWFNSSGLHRALHSFPTRRSSDLEAARRDPVRQARPAGRAPHGQRRAVDRRGSARETGRGLSASAHHPRLARAVEARSEEHTSELQSRENLVCRLLLEKKKKPKKH